MNYLLFSTTMAEQGAPSSYRSSLWTLVTFSLLFHIISDQLSNSSTSQSAPQNRRLSVIYRLRPLPGPCGRITASCSSDWALLTLGWRRDAPTTKGKRSIMFNQSLRVKNAGPRWGNTIPKAGALPLFEAASWSHSIALFSSSHTKIPD